MATKTITIDVDAYERLKSVQKPTESFSQTIKRVVRRPIDVKAWFGAMDRASLSRRQRTLSPGASRRDPAGRGGRAAIAPPSTGINVFVTPCYSSASCRVNRRFGRRTLGLSRRAQVWTRGRAERDGPAHGRERLIS